MRKFLYHKNCHDGFCAAWIAKHVWPDADFIPVGYYDTPPDVTDCEVIIADFSFPRAEMLAMKAKAKSLLVFDHHISAQKALMGLDFCEFDMTKSGARLIYDYFRLKKLIDPATFPQWLVDYTEDRDLWTKRLSSTNEINAAIRSRPYTFEAWDELAASSIIELIQEGRGILKYQEIVIEQHLRHVVEVEINGIKGKGCQCTVSTLISDIGDAILKDKTAPFAAIWCDTTDNRRIYSLRSRSEFNVSELAASFPGGGGHKAAAGFTITHQGLIPVDRMPIHRAIEALESVDTTQTGA
jgi:uncharacterized protein